MDEYVQELGYEERLISRTGRGLSTVGFALGVAGGAIEIFAGYKGGYPMFFLPLLAMFFFSIAPRMKCERWLEILFVVSSLGWGLIVLSTAMS